MRQGGWVRIGLVAATAAAAGGATAQPPQKVTPPIAVYWMSASTQTGFGMPGAGGAKPSAGSMMQMMMGGGGGANRSLLLQLGSSQTNPAPAADHLPPPALNMGASLPLVTPKIPPKEPAQPESQEIPQEYRKPQGRILIFWGCGEHAKPGQPVVIDMASMASGQPPAGLSALRGLNVSSMNPPSPARNKTYGEWPNEKKNINVPANASLVGAHTVKGDYSPQIDFKLDEDQDFLGPLNLTTNARQPGGWVNLGWNLVGNAQGYLASAIGGAQGPGGGATMVLWSSSETGAAGFVMPDYLSNGDISRLVAAKALMGPATKTCSVPKEVIDAMPQGLLQMTAYGGEANFVYPPRPTDPKVTWNQEWAVKVRYRSATGGLLGMEMPGMGGGGRGGRAGFPTPSAGQDEGAAPGQQPQQPAGQPRKPKASDILKGLGGVGGLPGLPFPR